jgi:AbrB family looped-hinge helix DNA binding protein
MTDPKEIPVSRHFGFAEEAAKPMVSSLSQKWRLKVGKDGRVLIPAAVRALMELDAEGQVMATIEDGGLELVSPKVALRRIHAITARFKKPDESIVDEFIAERRAEALREDQE